MKSALKKNIRITALTQGKDVPSTRFRWSQYVPNLLDAGLNVTESPSKFGAYAPASLMDRPFWLTKTLSQSLVRAALINSSDVCFLQRNLVATLYTWEWLIKGPIVFDVDDAIFIGSRGSAANRIAQQAEMIICGNNYLAEHFSRYGKVKVLPTAIDVDRFRPGDIENCDELIIGWSGTSGGFQYLYQIEDALADVLRVRSNVILKIISDRPPKFKSLPSYKVHFEPWNALTEVASLQTFSIGIMPLNDDEWARGKCSFKMLTYMAIGIPVVVSPVGMNIEVLAKGVCGISAKSHIEWVEALIQLVDEVSARKAMGSLGRGIVEKFYSRDVIGAQLANTLINVAP